VCFISWFNFFHIQFWFFPKLQGGGGGRNLHFTPPCRHPWRWTFSCVAFCLILQDLWIMKWKERGRKRLLSWHLAWGNHENLRVAGLRSGNMNPVPPDYEIGVLNIRAGRRCLVSLTSNLQRYVIRPRARPHAATQAYSFLPHAGNVKDCVGMCTRTLSL
jgi:hypothetical protein